MQALPLWRKAWRRWYGRAAGIIWRFSPVYAYMEQAYAQFKEHCPEINCIKQENAMDEQQKAAFLAQFVPGPSQPLLGFAVMGGVFGEGVDLTGDRLIGVGIVGPGLPQVGPRQEQLRDYLSRHAVPALTTPTVTPA